MQLQLIVNSRLMAKVLGTRGRKVPVFLLFFALSAFISIGYAKNTRPVTSAPVLDSQEIDYINLLSSNVDQIPAWLIAQLLGPSARLRQFTTSQPAGPEVSLNELLANPDRFRSKVIAVKAEFMESSDVKEELQLLPPDHCWSAIFLDATYHQPIQLFTPEDPSGFKKHSDVLIFGYYLTNRTDRSKSVFSSKSLIIPVVTGIIIPSVTRSTRNNTPPEDTILVNVYPLLAAIVLLLVAFFALRYYISKQDKKQGDFYLIGSKTTIRTEKWKK